MTGSSGRLVVVVSAENSGSSLVSAVLGGGARVLAPTETHIFRYPDFETWRRKKPQALASLCWLMEALDLPAQPDELAARFGGRSPNEIYSELLRLCGPSRVLVEKTPAYARDTAVLRDIERLEPDWVWLVRHPLGVLASNLDGMARTRTRRRAQAKTLGRKLAVAVRHGREWLQNRPAGLARDRLSYWLELNERIEAFLGEVSSVRVHRLHYERLVRNPEPEIEKLCAALRIPFEPAMLEPSGNVPSSLAWGLGHEKVAKLATVDASRADDWRKTLDESLLNDPIRRAMERFEID